MKPRVEPATTFMKSALEEKERRLETGQIRQRATDLIAAYEKALDSQRDNGPDAKMMVLANYGERAIALLRALIANH